MLAEADEVRIIVGSIRGHLGPTSQPVCYLRGIRASPVNNHPAHKSSTPPRMSDHGQINSYLREPQGPHDKMMWEVLHRMVAVQPYGSPKHLLPGSHPGLVR